MKLATKIVILLLIATITVTSGGCIEETEVAPEPESLHNNTTNISAVNLPLLPGLEIRIVSFSSVYMRDNWDEESREWTYNLSEWYYAAYNRSIKNNGSDAIDFKVNLTLLPGIEDGLEIRIVSFSSLYMRDNWDEESREWTYNPPEWYYAAYNLSIKNNGSDTIDFKVNDLYLHAGDQLFNTTTRKLYNSSVLEVLEDLGNENRIEDTTLSLSPGQTVNGSVVFCVDSLYDRSFLLIYNATPVTSESFKESLEALEAAERFDYSVAFGIPPYHARWYGEYRDSYEPGPERTFTWANWVNRSIFEFFKTADFETLQKSLPDDIPVTEIWYAIKVMPERNITVVSGNRLLVIDDFGEELINKSWSSGVVILRNGTYERQTDWAIDIPQMTIPDATIVQISFAGIFGWDMSMRISYNNQDVILDDGLMMLARYYDRKVIS